MATPFGFIGDSGASFSTDKSNTAQQLFGWNRANPNALELHSPHSPSLEYDTFVAMRDSLRSYSWQASVPSANYYAVHIVSGDPVTYDCQDILVERESAMRGCPNAAEPWMEYRGIVAVTDGKLSINTGSSGGVSKLNVVEVSFATGAIINTVFSSILPPSRNSNKKQGTAITSQDFVSIIAQLTGEPDVRFLPLHTQQRNDTAIEVTYLVVDTHLLMSGTLSFQLPTLLVMFIVYDFSLNF